MIKSTIQCPACRAIFNARAVAKRAAPAHAEALLKATDALVKIHAMPTAPDVLMAEMLAGMAALPRATRKGKVRTKLSFNIAKV